MSKYLKIIISAFMVLGLASMVSAIDTPGGAATTIGPTGTFTATSAGNASAQGGNVTEVNLTSSASTTKWQGFYGNISGTVSLGSGSTVFYDFGSTAFSTIFATTATDLNWATLAASTASEVDTRWNFNTASDVDQAVDVYTTTDTFAGVGSVPSVTLHGNFSTGVMEDGDDAAKGDYAFAGNINSSSPGGFGGGSYQYEIMVPVETGTETYFFYLSLQ